MAKTYLALTIFIGEKLRLFFVNMGTLIYVSISFTNLRYILNTYLY